MDDCHLNNITKLMIFLKKHFVAPCSAYTNYIIFNKKCCQGKFKYLKCPSFTIETLKWNNYSTMKCRTCHCTKV